MNIIGKELILGVILSDATKYYDESVVFDPDDGEIYLPPNDERDAVYICTLNLDDDENEIIKSYRSPLEHTVMKRALALVAMINAV